MRARPGPGRGGDAVEAVVVDMASGPFGGFRGGWRTAAGAAGAWPRVARAAGRTTLSSTWATRSGRGVDVEDERVVDADGREGVGQQVQVGVRADLSRARGPARTRRAPGRAWAATKRSRNAANRSASRCIAGTRAPSTAGESSHRPPGPQAWASRSRAQAPGVVVLARARGRRAGRPPRPARGRPWWASAGRAWPCWPGRRWPRRRTSACRSRPRRAAPPRR